MLAKTQYTTDDWLQMHGLMIDEVQNYCRLIQSHYKTPADHNNASQVDQHLQLDFHQSLHNLVMPSIQKILNLDDLFMEKLARVQVNLYQPSDLRKPHTAYNAEENTHVIHMSWSGKAEDIICLAHEMAHAAQMLLSKDRFMSPVARETCAFLGELALIQYTQHQSDALFQQLSSVWHEENQYYLGTDVELLLHGLSQQTATYIYQHNYPLARIAAMWLFYTSTHQKSGGLLKLFCNDREKYTTDIQAAFTALEQHGFSALSNEEAQIQHSLSPHAWSQLQTMPMHPSWFNPVANVNRIDQHKQLFKVADLNLSLWLKWRSLGVCALTAIHQNQADVTPTEFINAHRNRVNQLPNPNCMFSVPWAQANSFDALTTLGLFIQLLATSTYHQNFPLSHYLPVEILPAIQLRQYQCYIDDQGNPIGMVIWAWLSESVKQDIHTHGYALEPQEWLSGQHLFFNDWITHSGAFKPAMKHMTQEIFPDEIASSLRRTPDGHVRRINQWVGRNRKYKYSD